MFTFSQIKDNKQILEFINKTQKALTSLAFTEHGLRHAVLVADRSRNIARELNLSKRDQELSGIAGFCHDIGNFIGRTQHHYWGALLFHQVFGNEENIQDVVTVMQAIANHDKGEEMKLGSSISAIVVLADKSDVCRERVLEKDANKIKNDIHDRVNFAVTDSKLKIDKKKKRIILTLKIDTNFTPIMDYFEIFTDRMIFCRDSARYLGYEFGLVMNQTKLL